MNKLKLISLISLSFLVMACEPEFVARKPILQAKSEAFLHCNETVPYGFPQFRIKDKFIDENTLFSCHDNYTLAYNIDYRMAYWTAEHLFGDKIAKYENTEKRDDRLRPDVNIPKVYGDLADEELANANEHGYNYRPFVSLSNWLGDQRAMSKTYYFTNMFPYPQDQENINAYKKYLTYLEKIEKENKNRERKGEELLEIKDFKPVKKDTAKILWQNIESHIRDLAKKYSEVYVFSGSVFYKSNNSPTGYLNRFGLEKKEHTFQKRYESKELIIKDQFSKVGLAVPSHIYKLLYFPKQNQTIVYIVPNNIGGIRSVNPQDYQQSLETLERITNINFFPLKNK